MIDGIKVKKLRFIPDERGRLMEILRCDDELFEKFGQAYLTVGYPGVVKAWHYHKKQVDHFCAIYGMVKVVLYDAREDSPTKGEINEFFMGVHNEILLRVPKLVYHGFKAIGQTEGMILNFPTEQYDRDNPDEYRIDPFDNDIPYDWNIKEG